MNLNTEIKQEKEIHPLGHPTRPFTNRPCPPICTHFFPFTVPKIITCSLKAPRTAVRLQHCAGTEMKQEDGGGGGGGVRKWEQNGAARRISLLYFALCFHLLPSSSFMFCLRFGFVYLCWCHSPLVCFSLVSLSLSHHSLSPPFKPPFSFPKFYGAACGK